MEKAEGSSIPHCPALPAFGGSPEQVKVPGARMFQYLALPQGSGARGGARVPLRRGLSSDLPPLPGGMQISPA